MSMYQSSFNSNGEVGEKKGDDDDDEVKEKSTAELRREELLKVMMDRSLDREERAHKMEEVRQKYNTDGGAAVLEATEKEETSKIIESSSPSLDEQQRRQELQSIMKDKSLSREDKRQKMEVVKWKYSQEHNTGTTTTTTPPQSSTEKNNKVHVDLSAKTYAERRRASLQSLEESIGSNGSNNNEGGARVMSLRERKSMIAQEMSNNENDTEGQEWG